MLDDRFWQKVEKTDSCWLWTASVVQGPRGGYGQFRVGKKMRKAHVLAYEEEFGAIPAGSRLDHLCRQRRCVRPDHLEPVSNAENLRRSPLAPANRTHCPQEHAYTPENTYVGKLGQRECRTCKRERQAAKLQTAAGRAEHAAYLRAWRAAKKAETL